MNRPLYDKVRQDLFEEKKKSSLRIPSITTICLLQIQAFTVQLLSNLPSISAARLLNVESEIKDIITEDDDGYYSQKSDQCTKRNSSTNESGTSEPITPNKKSSGHSMVSPSSPIHSPTPNFVLYPISTTRSVNSPILAPSRVNHTNRARSSSFNNTTDKQQGQQQLRRSPGRREITVHNAILPIQRKHHHHHHRQSEKKANSTANSVTSRSSSESSTGRPRMQKTMSLSTAQQYQQQQQQHHHHHNESSLSNSTRITTPKECLTNRKDPLKGAVLPAHYHKTLPWKQ
ncbi:hypothetical protein INT48_002477 [Thamnidium elegans]|uniref:Uncharacterized protein n=1 Tax=Thamnidium elegans TaxID=101142 RepID=A0A8H7SH96_9FUNG|nr:hypothetical protein INT48_002477 [Thamnidium elegans]